MVSYTLQMNQMHLEQCYLNINNGNWDSDLLDIFNIPANILPTVVESSKVVGYTDKSIFGKEIPIAGIMGDQQAATFGHACTEPRNDEKYLWYWVFLINEYR